MGDDDDASQNKYKQNNRTAPVFDLSIFSSLIVNLH